MTSRDWMCLLAAAGNFALAVLSLVRGRQSVVAKPLARLCFALFVWNFATLVEHVGTGRSDHTHSFLTVSNAPLWGVVDGIFTALSPPLMLHLIATFVGARRERAPFVVASYVVFGALALSSATGLFSTWGQDWTGSSAWAAAFLAGSVPLWRGSCGTSSRRATTTRRQGRAPSSRPLRSGGPSRRPTSLRLSG